MLVAAPIVAITIEPVGTRAPVSIVALMPVTMSVVAMTPKVTVKTVAAVIAPVSIVVPMPILGVVVPVVIESAGGVDQGIGNCGADEYVDSVVVPMVGSSAQRQQRAQAYAGNREPLRRALRQFRSIDGDHDCVSLYQATGTRMHVRT